MNFSSRSVVLALLLGMLLGGALNVPPAISEPTVSGGTFIGGSVINPIQFPDGTAAAPSVTFSGNTQLGCWRTSNDLRCGGSGIAAFWSFQNSSGTLFQIGGASGNWNVNNSGHLIAGVDNQNDIGAAGATRPRNIFAGTGFAAAGSTGQSVTTTVRASGGAADCTLIFTGGLKTGGTC